ncbi:MAG: mitochondrial fission ELM1 family protein [Alphaproteobacteria bacterium]|nr:mitochondrial fission ELM1 family protein [Alphaproteobacteria bacterium]
MTEKSCWILTEGMAGTENQALGLAEALGMRPEVKRVRARAPWRWLPAALWPCPLAAQASGADPLRPPWPDLLISGGRKSVAMALAIKAKSRGRTFAVHLLNPYGCAKGFDLVTVPRHDHLEGNNVVVTEGALTRITPARLAAALGRHGERLGRLAMPRFTVLLGGANKHLRFTPRAAEELAVLLKAAVGETGGSLLITPSRRTPAEALARLRAGLEGVAAEIWEGGGDNPYFAYLAAADAIVVTNDSISMASEAASTGKPVYVFDLEGEARKFRTFHENLRAKGIARPFDGTFERWVYAPLDDTARVAEAVRTRMASKGG